MLAFISFLGGLRLRSGIKSGNSLDQAGLLSSPTEVNIGDATLYHNAVHILGGGTYEYCRR